MMLTGVRIRIREKGYFSPYYTAKERIIQKEHIEVRKNLKCGVNRAYIEGKK